MSRTLRPEVLCYVGYDDDQGGIVAVVRALAAVGRFDCVLGVNSGWVGRNPAALSTLALPSIAGERINLVTAWRARKVARAVCDWLDAKPDRIFHGHSRAGLLVALWLQHWHRRRVVVSVHCYGRQRWFYRWAARRLGRRLFWLTPAMRDHYDVTGRDWEQCLPGGVPEDASTVIPAVATPGRVRLGAAGAMVRWKRWDLVLEALAVLSPTSRAQVSFEHIGAASSDPESQAYAGELRRLTGALGVAEMVRWCGPEPSAQRLLSAVDLIVVPSDHEPYSMILQEAWAAGVPVIAADSGGPRDLIRPGTNGWLFSSGQPKALAALLEQRVRTRDWARLDRATIRQSARRAGDVAEAWESVYAQL